MNNRELARWVKLTEAIRKHEDDAEELKEQRKALEGQQGAAPAAAPKP